VPGGRRLAELGIAATTVASVAATTLLIYRDSSQDPAVLGFWALTAGVLLWGVLSHVGDTGRYLHQPVAPGKVLAIIPAYNETTEAVHATVHAVLAQTVPCDILVIDDGSVTPVHAFPHPRVRWARQANAGKRAAQITGLYATDRGDHNFVFTVDSDSEPHPDALENLLRAMSDPQVWAATGWVNTRNYADNWVARCADLDIGTALVMNRSSRTQIGAVETMSGALALYRADLLWEEAEGYLLDTSGAGDDHWLTARALLRGKAVGVNEAIVDTDMPTEIRRTYQQRARWCKSTFLMAGFSIVRYRWLQLVPLLINFIFLVTAPLCLAAVIVAAAWSRHHGAALGGLSWADLAAFATLAVIGKLALCGLYLLRRPSMPTRQKWLSMLAAGSLLFVFGIFAVVLPRYLSLMQLRQIRWTTREVTGMVAQTPPTFRPVHVPRRKRATGAIPADTIRRALQARPTGPEARRRRDLESTAVLDIVEVSNRLHRS
jgi:cellulose synthase/poly-beta-1,6-N-acetylglucosamine synthase-like glycosyltransferase